MNTLVAKKDLILCIDDDGYFHENGLRWCFKTIAYDYFDEMLVAILECSGGKKGIYVFSMTDFSKPLCKAWLENDMIFISLECHYNHVTLRFSSKGSDRVVWLDYSLACIPLGMPDDFVANFRQIASNGKFEINRCTMKKLPKECEECVVSVKIDEKTTITERVKCGKQMCCYFAGDGVWRKFIVITDEKMTLVCAKAGKVITRKELPNDGNNCLLEDSVRLKMISGGLRFIGKKNQCEVTID